MEKGDRMVALLWLHRKFKRMKRRNFEGKASITTRRRIFIRQAVRAAVASPCLRLHRNFKLHLKIFLKKDVFLELFFSPQLFAKAVSSSFCWALRSFGTSTVTVKTMSP